MWIVTGNTLAEQTISIRVPATKDTDKGNVIGLAFAEHAKTSPADPLKYDTLEVAWSFDNVHRVAEVKIKHTVNYQVQKRVGKGLWERHSDRAFRNIESANEALEGAATGSPNDKFRIVQTYTDQAIVAVSKNAVDVIGEQPDKPVKAPAGLVNEEPAPKPAPKTSKTPAKA